MTNPDTDTDYATVNITIDREVQIPTDLLEDDAATDSQLRERAADWFWNYPYECLENESGPSKDDIHVESVTLPGEDEPPAPPRLFDARDVATFQAAVETWGINAQADMAEEEAAEFIAASKHYARGKIGDAEIIDELADIRIMYEQLALFLGSDRVADRVEQKMDRLRERLERATDGDTDE